MTTVIGTLSAFDVKEQTLEEYCEILEQFFEANEIDDVDKQRAILISVVGPATYKLIRNLLPTMTAHISELDVSLNKAEEQNLRGKGFKQVLANLNKGAGGCDIYLWYKTGPMAITRIQVSFNHDMTAGLINLGYKKINKDLNAGAGGNKIYLWSYQGTGEYDTPIKAIEVTTEEHNEAAKFRSDWQRLACDLNRRAGGNRIHIWVQREKKTFICDITATDSYGADGDLFGGGYLRVDEDTNRGAGGSSVFIWYRQTTDTKRAITDVQVAVGEEEAKAFPSQGYTIVNTNLNEGTSGDQVFLFHKKVESDSPVKAIALLVNQSLVKDYEKAGLRVIEKSLNSGNDGHLEFLCLFQ